MLDISTQSLNMNASFPPLTFLLLLCSVAENHWDSLLTYLPASLVLIRVIVPVGNLKCKFELVSLRPSVAPYVLKNQDKVYALFINSHSTICYIEQLVSSRMYPWRLTHSILQSEFYCPPHLPKLTALLDRLFSLRDSGSDSTRCPQNELGSPPSQDSMISQVHLYQWFTIVL